MGKKILLKKGRKNPPMREECVRCLQYDGNADCFPQIVEHFLQSKRIPPKYLGFPRDLWLISFTS